LPAPTRWIREFGYISIPVLAGTAFALISILFVAAWRISMSVQYPKQRQVPKKKTHVPLPEQQRADPKPNQVKPVLGLIALVAIVAVGAVALNLGSGSDKPSAGSDNVGNAAAVAEMLEDIPQSGGTLGRADAPVTLVEYATCSASSAPSGLATPCRRWPGSTSAPAS